MYLILQMWLTVLVGAGLGVGLGWGLCHWWAGRGRVAQDAQAAQVAAVRADAMTDLLQLRGELEDSRAWHAREISELRAGHEAALAEVRQVHRAELQQLQQAHEAQDTLRQAQLNMVEQAHAAVRLRLDALSQTSAVESAQEIARLQAELNAAREARRSDAAAWMARLRASSETAAVNEAQAQSRLAAALADVRQRDAALQEAQGREATLTAQLRRFKQASGVVLRAQLDSFQARQQAQAAQGESLESVEALRAQWLAAVQAQNEAQADLQTREAAWQAEKDALVMGHEAVQEELAEQLAASRRTAELGVRAGEAREERLSVEIIELRAELDRLRRERAEATRRAVAQHRPSRLALLDIPDVARLVQAAGAGRPPQAVAPDGREPDDLEAIDGVDGATAHWLRGMGILFYWQIAAWTAEEAAWVGQHLPSRGDVVWLRNWMAQCARLSAQEGMHVG